MSPLATSNQQAEDLLSMLLKEVEIVNHKLPGTRKHLKSNSETMCKEIYLFLANRMPLAAILKKEHSCYPTIKCGKFHLLLLSILWESKCFYEATIAVDSFWINRLFA